MKHSGKSMRARLMATVAAGAIVMTAGQALAQEVSRIDLAPQSLASALYEFGRQTGHQVIFSPDLTRAKNTQGVSGAADEQLAMAQLLTGTGLTYRRDGNTYMIVSASDPQSGSAAGDGADQGTVQALIVTAQKREENIQDVPIAMSAFTQEALERSQVAGGPDLITQVPNMTFTKTNFSSYSIQLRGIGTQAISATVDPAVAVAFNNTPFIRNRFFEQEFYDLQRVEVLRGPQGTLYGRNATAGVVNLISQKAKLDSYEAKVSADVANYSSSRLEGMINIPLANDVAALRIAGAWTKREGYSTNELNGNPIDGRDLWSTRVSLRFAPTDRLDANLIWEHFEENDDRIRSGKQLCKTDLVTEVAGYATPNFYQLLEDEGLGWPVQGTFSQGCAPASLYSPDSFQKTNSLALPYYAPLGIIGLPVARVGLSSTPIDPYASATQSRDLRVIEAAVDPSYKAKTDIAELQFSYNLSDDLTLSSETSWGSDFIFSTQDYNRFAGAPHSWDTSVNLTTQQYIQRGILSPEGVFCDPQIGCSDRLAAMDLSTARSRQFSQELRLASDYDGPFNFSLGGNFLRYDTEDKYYVFINSLTMISAFKTAAGAGVGGGTGMWVPGVTDNRDCLINGMIEPDYTKVQPILQCTYIDPNPINNLNDLGHNYFLSRNPYKLISYAVFGEAYYKLAENLKLTAGLRWTVDKKEAPMRPSWLLASNTVGHPIAEVVEQEWKKPTGRLAVDWKPDLSFTDETMVYASFAHGYKAGGMNPPPFGVATFTVGGNSQNYANALLGGTAVHPKTFEPEYVNALELGAKNTLLDGALTANLAAFYYNYKGYQLSQIVDRSAVTQNFDADIWGVELESDWRPAENLRFGLKLGYEKTKVADGERAIDLMDRTAGDPNWVIVKPFPSIPSNCVLPTWLFLGFPDGGNGSPHTNPWLVGVGGIGGGGAGGCELAYLLGQDPATAQPFVVDPTGYVTEGKARTNVNYPAWSTDLADYPCWPAGVPITQRNYPGVDPVCLAAMSNNGQGFFKNLSGNELPNAPHITATITADYTLPLPSNWLMTLHTDLYYQSESWTRIFNTEGYDKLKAYSNINLAAIFTNEDAGWKVMAYVKNVLDRDSITGAFLNSDDTGLTTNVFLTEPRLYGLRITKDFVGGPWWTGANLDHKGPFPFTIELGGQLLHQDAPYERLRAAWVDALPEAIALQDLQNRDLDTGDGRSIKLTYRPDASPWSISASYRQGQANTDTARTNGAQVERLEVCRWPDLPFLPYYNLFCAADAPVDNPTQKFLDVSNWSDAESRSREEQNIADIAVGYDLPANGALKSTVSVGLRHADLESRTFYAANTQSGWVVPDGYFVGFFDPAYLTSNHVRHLTMNAERQFRGMGPVATWQASLPLWGGEDIGRVTADWSITGGALFGGRETTITGQDNDELHRGDLGQYVTTEGEDASASVMQAALPVESTAVNPIDIRRSKDVTVPLLDLSLGLSYDVGRIKVSTGYRWERYFDVLDVGQDDEKKADRTIDGPYFKIAVGFGG